MHESDLFGPSRKRTSALLLLILLTACGGGGGNGSTITAAVPAETSSPVADVATAPSTLPAPTLSDSTDWPTFDHDLSRTGTQPAPSGLTSSTIGQMQLLWSYRSASNYDLASPVEAGGVVYAVDEAGNMIAVQAATGAELWQRSFGSEVKVTPSIYDGHLFVGTFADYSKQDSTLYSLDPATGAVEWKVPVPGGIHGSPIALNGQLYVPLSLGDPGFCNPGGVYVFDESTGKPGIDWLVGGSVKSNGGAIWSPLTYDGTRILYGTGNTCLTSPQTANAIVALSQALQIEWSYSTANAMSDDDIGGGVIEAGSTAYVTGKTGNLYAFSPTTGALQWQKNLGVPDLYGSYSTPVIVESTLLTSVGYRYDPYSTQPTGTQFGALDGVDPATGTILWQDLATSPFYEPPAIVSGMAITTIDSAVAALDPATGATLWSTPINGYSRSAVAVANGEIIVADSDGFLYAYGLPTQANAALRERTRRSIRIVQSKPHFVNRIPKFCKLN